jgi:hypothetical protein
MEIYKSEEVIESLSARIHPTDNRVPECRCYIRLTTGHIFISEDNYDGTYEDHYILDVAQIDDIKISEPYKTSIGFTSDSLDKNAGKKSVDRRTGRLGEMFSGSNKRHGAFHPDIEAASRKFLEIIYRENYEKTECLYFDDCSGVPSVFINAFVKLKRENKKVE